MVFVHVDDIAHTQATMERFAAELRETFKGNLMIMKENRWTLLV